MDKRQLKKQLNAAVKKYERPEFIEHDPISIPKKFTALRDIEITALFMSVIAWGNRTAILKSGDLLLRLFENAPSDFILNAGKKDFFRIKNFYHRTFTGNDAFEFASALRRIYCSEHYNSLEALFAPAYPDEPLVDRMEHFREEFTRGFSAHAARQVANMKAGSAAKKLNLFLRWMVRSDKNGVDFGLWKSISPCQLYLPLDVHSARVSRSLGLLHRKSNDAKAVFEVTNALKEFCPEDPVKYDFALFASDI